MPFVWLLILIVCHDSRFRFQDSWFYTRSLFVTPLIRVPITRYARSCYLCVLGSECAGSVHPVGSVFKPGSGSDSESESEPKHPRWSSWSPGPTGRGLLNVINSTATLPYRNVTRAPSLAYKHDVTFLSQSRYTALHCCKARKAVSADVVHHRCTRTNYVARARSPRSPPHKQLMATHGDPRHPDVARGCLRLKSQGLAS